MERLQIMKLLYILVTIHCTSGLFFEVSHHPATDELQINRVIPDTSRLQCLGKCKQYKEACKVAAFKSKQPGIGDCMLYITSFEMPQALGSHLTQGQQLASQIYDMEGAQLLKDVNNCVTGHPECGTNASCIPKRDTYECVCDSGFQGDGLTCDNIDECASNTHNCTGVSVCVDTHGGFECVCPPGYLTMNATQNGTQCLNKNECELNTHNCHEKADCNDTEGSYLCKCYPGWHGDGTACTDINECEAASHDCHSNASCTNTVGSFNCLCKPHYTGNGTVCTQLIDCQNNTGICDKNAVCVIDRGLHRCQCNEGWRGNGINCVNINECTEGNHTCASTQNCSDTAGSYDCRCQHGFVKDKGGCRSNFGIKFISESSAIPFLTKSLSSAVESTVCAYMKGDGTSSGYALAIVYNPDNQKCKAPALKFTGKTFAVYADGNFFSQSDSRYKNLWHHICLSWKGNGATGTIKMYINSTLLDSSISSSNLKQHTPTSMSIYVGNLPRRNSQCVCSLEDARDGFIGEIRDLYVWTRTLTINEITQVRQGKAIPKDQLMFEWEDFRGTASRDQEEVNYT